MNEIKIYSEEVCDILADPPRAIYRWGNTILLGFIILLVILSWMIRYPDIISAPVLITTNMPPQKLMARTTGNIEALLVKDRQNVAKNTPLAVIENTANYKDVFLLKSIVDTINPDRNLFPFELLKSAQLGDVESAFAVFQKEYSVEELNRKLQPFQIEKTAHSIESFQLRDRLNLLQSQKSIAQNELELEKTDFQRYQTLFNKGIVAPQELERHKLTYLQSEKAYKNLLSTISTLKSSLNELNKNSQTSKINESKENVNLERNELQAFFQLKKAIRDWEMNYVLRSSIAGTITFLQVWNENQFVSAGDNVFSIIPATENGYIGKVKAVALNSGKIKTGQEVNVRLTNYPDREFGMIRGIVKTISLTPDKEGNLLINISLPKGLVTSYNKKIIFQQEMTGNADIVTEDLRLMERLLYQFRDVFKR